MGRRPSMGHNRRHSRQPNTGIGFFKIILPNTIQENKLSLPLKFVRKYGDELSNVAKLILPNSDVWQVVLRKEKEGIFLSSGLDEFFKYYSICYGSFLVFKYKGMSNFGVRIFDMTACDIEYPCHEPRNDEEPSKREKQQILHDEMEDDDDFFEILNSNLHPSSSKEEHNERKVFVMNHEHAAASEKRKFQQGKGKSFKMEEEDKTILIKRKSRTKLDGIGMRTKSVETKIFTSLKFYATLSKMPQESQIAVKAAFNSNPRNPSFLVIMLNYMISDNVMTVPATFARRYLHSESDEIKIEDSGREWLVRSFWSWRGRSLRLENGWAEFFINNCLKEGDMCLFELMERKNIVLKAKVYQI